MMILNNIRLIPKNISFLRVQYWLSKGCPKEKLIVGIPTYGRGFSVQANSNMKPPLPANGGSTAGPITREAGYLG